jgi:hypothetical protein
MTLLILSAVVHLLLNRSETLIFLHRRTTRNWRRPGSLLDASGLQLSSKGWCIEYSGGKRTVIDGPFAETKELIAGYTLIQVKSREEAGLGASPIPRAGPFEIRPAEDLTEMIRESEHRRSRAKGE